MEILINSVNIFDHIEINELKAIGFQENDTFLRNLKISQQIILTHLKIHLIIKTLK